MRALTVRQPWAWAIVHGGKDVENRTRNVAGSYRGPVAIHAGLAVAEAGMESPLVLAAAREVDPEQPPVIHAFRRGWRRAEAAVGGAFIGVVDLVGVCLPGACPDADGATCSPWCIPGHHHLWLSNPRPLPEPIPYRGNLGLWTPRRDGGDLDHVVIEQLQAVTR